MLRRTFLGTTVTAVAALGSHPRRVQAATDAVDVLLVLAVDVSTSIDEDEARLQRQGYCGAIADPKVVAAVRGGMLGAIGLAYVEWAGVGHQRLVIPWTRVASQADADEWAETLGQAPRQSLSFTSVSGGIDFSRQILDAAHWETARRVIDISGDGVNNSGPPPEQARDRAVAEGIVINGLPILFGHPARGHPSAEALDAFDREGATGDLSATADQPTYDRPPPPPLGDYYRASVIGGPGAFLIVADTFDNFGVALRRKLIREIAGLPPWRWTALPLPTRPLERRHGARPDQESHSILTRRPSH